MAFEAFLEDTHARPLLASVLGYLTSLAVHAPPVALFVSTWLTHSLLIGNPGEFLAHQRISPAFSIPTTIMSSAQAAQVLGKGNGAGGGAGNGVGTVASKEPTPRRNRRGRVGRSGRRGLISPRNVERFPSERMSPETFAFLDSLGSSPDGPPGSGDNDGEGRGDATGKGTGRSGDGDGNGSGGLDYAGGGGSGVTSLAASSPMMGAALVAAAVVKKAQRAQHPAGRGKSDRGDPFEDEQEVEAPPAPGRPVKASYISEETAAYFRTDSTFPSLPDSYWDNAVREYPVTLEICVSAEGSVSNVTVTRRAGNDDIDTLVCSAVRSWRYRPRMVAGVARPFCHPIVIRYSRQLRFFSP
jgi:TonB family protein